MKQDNMAKRLRAARGKRTVETVAEKAGITREALLAYEAGLRRPRDEVKLRLAQVLHTSIGFLFFDENDTKRDNEEEERCCPWCGREAAYLYRRGEVIVGCEQCTVMCEIFELPERG